MLRRVGLVGAGYIATVHAEALRAIPNVKVTAVIDKSIKAASNIASIARCEYFSDSLDDAISENAFDTAHILTPPDTHAGIALKIINSGRNVFIEKPISTKSEECVSIQDAAVDKNVYVGINQNFVFHPSVQKIINIINNGDIGNVSHISCIYNAPLHQLEVRQFSHWMFSEPINILLEQAVHPLSLIQYIAGDIDTIRAVSEPALELAPGMRFHQSLTAVLRCSRMPATLRFAVGQPFPFWQLSVVGSDGVAVADILTNRVYCHSRTRYLDAADVALSSASTGIALASEGLRYIARYALSTMRLKKRSDPFFISMQSSIAAFHAALDAGRAPEVDAVFGTKLVRVCENLAGSLFSPEPPVHKVKSRVMPKNWDVAVLGGTGFIGTETVRILREYGFRVSVLSRSPQNLPAVFDDDAVAVFRGDIRDKEAVRRAIGGARVVVNLAHGGGGTTYEAIRNAMVGGAEAIALLSREQGVDRLIHVGSIASLYLGPNAGTITGATPPDPKWETRSDYARAKAETDLMLINMATHDRLPLVILRPGLVVGAGTPAFHAGLGFTNNTQHCIGWNRGNNPLPFVLVQDVAKAIVSAIRTRDIEGRSYNLVGDVRMTAREFITELARATHRPLKFHPQWPAVLFAGEVGKWAIKTLSGRRTPLLSWRDLLSRGSIAEFDCSDVKNDIGWRPVEDRNLFIKEAIEVHRK